MDDLSLIRIEYNGRIKMSPTGSALELLAEIEPHYKNRDFPGCLKVYQAYPRNSSPDLPPVIFRWVAIACFFQKKYKEAAHLALNYLNHNPAHNSIIYLAARSLYLDANYMQAKHLMDRLLIRQPDQIAYIILQARILYETGDIMEAIKLLNRFPDNKVVQKLLNKINRMQL